MPDAADDESIAPGATLAHYTVVRRIGSGAMGTVYEAHDTALDRAVALKVVNPGLSDEPEMADRFAREARAAARANHANLTHIYFVGSADGRPFYAMEYVPGENLEDRVARTGPLDLAETVDVVVQAALGLQAAHEMGVVHRDVKPSNLLLLPDGRLKVTDFGLAKSNGVDPSATMAGQVLGTPTYMSPEQCRGGAVDARTDVYALGLTAWFLLTGRPAFPSTSLGALINDQMNTPIPPLATAKVGISPAIDAVLRRLCAKNPEERPASMAEVVSLFEGVRPRALRAAPFATRVAALSIDGLILSIVFSALAYGAGQLAERTTVLPDYAWLEIVAASTGVLATLSQVGMEWRYGGSLGKGLLGVRVVAGDGTPASLASLLTRFILRFPAILWVAVPSGFEDSLHLHFSIGILQLAAFAAGALAWPLTGRRTLSDVLTGTRVAYVEPGDAPVPASGVRTFSTAATTSAMRNGFKRT